MMGTTVSLGTGAWYEDDELTLTFPQEWHVLVHHPRTPPPLRDRDIAAALEAPEGQPTIREVAQGRSHPVVIVDDLTRPTPANLVMPHLIRQLEDAGIDRGRITVIVGAGSHGPPPMANMARKVGEETAASCRVIGHDYRRDLVRVGRTSIGTPVIVNREIARSDLVIGVGGIYPQHSTGFGGGSKLALGILGKASIVALHYRHPGMAGSYRTDNSFRRDLDEIAMMIGMGTTVSLHVDERRRPVRIVSGDHLRYYSDAVAFSRDAFAAPPPGEADVVISNAYPMDVSLTFARSKGIIPLLHSHPTATKVMVAGCPEGVGHHGLFPFMNAPRFQRQRALFRTAVWRPREVPRKGVRKIKNAIRSFSGPRGAGMGGADPGAFRQAAQPIWLAGATGLLPARIPGMRALGSWDDLFLRASNEQDDGRPLLVVVYVCAPLQPIDVPEPTVDISGTERAALQTKGGLGPEQASR
jgi:lactate racemase